MMDDDELKRTHAPIFSLQREMKNDEQFRALCERYGLPWDFAAGYEPRGYNGPAPAQTKLLALLAEPGAISRTEARNLLPAITHRRWVEPYNLRLQEHYWRANLLELCRYIWPENTEESMFANLGKSCTFWMSLPPGAQTSQIPREPLDYFLQTYLKRFLALFSNAIILAAGGKAQARLRRVHTEFESCSAFTRPESNKPTARASWRRAGQSIAGRLGLRKDTARPTPKGTCVPTAMTEQVAPPAVARRPPPRPERHHQEVTDTTRIAIAARFKRESAESCLDAVRAARVKCLTAGQELVHAHYDLRQQNGIDPTVAELIAAVRRRYTPPRSQEDPFKFWRDYLVHGNIYRGIFEICQ